MEKKKSWAQLGMRLKIESQNIVGTSGNDKGLSFLMVIRAEKVRWEERIIYTFLLSLTRDYCH